MSLGDSYYFTTLASLNLCPVRSGMATGKGGEGYKSRAVVLFGSNLASTVGSPRFSAIERALTSIPTVKGKMSIFIGILLADATLSKGRGEARLQFKQKYKEFEYFYSVFWQLSHYCSRGPQSRHEGILPKHYSLCFTTRSLPCITSLYSMFYEGRPFKKVISKNLLFFFNEEALAH